MPYKVRCTLVSFTGDPEHFPCHFNYEIGDNFTYDGERFEGRICNGLLKNMAPVNTHRRMRVARSCAGADSRTCWSVSEVSGIGSCRW